MNQPIYLLFKIYKRIIKLDTDFANEVLQFNFPLLKNEVFTSKLKYTRSCTSY